MCTVSWSRNPERCVLLFNRDERRSRAEAVPPAVSRTGESSLHFLAPRDPEGGGTWVFVNEAGLIGCLLNNYTRRPPPGNASISRGRLLLNLAGSSTIEELESGLRNHLDAGSYVPCFLLALSPREEPVLWEWDGRNPAWNRTPALPFHTTSSYRPAEVAAARERCFRKHVADPLHPAPGELEKFHDQHDPENPAASVRMAREDARTVSTTRVDLGPERALMGYRPTDGGEYEFKRILRRNK